MDILDRPRPRMYVGEKYKEREILEQQTTNELLFKIMILLEERLPEKPPEPPEKELTKEEKTQKDIKELLDLIK